MYGSVGDANEDNLRKTHPNCQLVLETGKEYKESKGHWVSCKTLAKNLAKRRVCSLKWTLVCNSWRNGTVSTQKPLQNMYKTGNIRYNSKDSQIKRESHLDKRWRILSICEALEFCLAPSKGFSGICAIFLPGDGINPPREREREHVHIPTKLTGFLSEKHRQKKKVPGNGRGHGIVSQENILEVYYYKL